MYFSATTIAALALASTVSAHTHVIDLYVNGKDQGDGRGKYIRSPTSNSPVKDLTSANIVCNDKGTEVGSFVSAAAGDEITFEWYHDNRGDDIIDGSHKGPIITYIAPYTSGNGAESIWTKIAEEGYDASTKLWAVDNLKTNGGKASFTLPSSLAAGQYLIRQEIIAHHESDTTFDVNSARGAQFYPSCAQIEVTGTGSDVPPQNFNFNTGYTYADPGIHFNLYGSFTSYSIPGPEVWTGGSGSGGSAPTTTKAPAATTTAPAATSTAAATTPATTPATTLATSVKPTAVSSAKPTSTGSPRPCTKKSRKARKARRNARKN